MARTKMALHWKIMIGLALGIAIGIVFNAAWGPATWAALGVDHPTAFIKSQPGVVPILPDGVEAVEDLDTFAGRDDDPLLEDRAPFQMTAAQIAAYELQTSDANQNPSAIADVASAFPILRSMKCRRGRSLRRRSMSAPGGSPSPSC